MSYTIANYSRRESEIMEVLFKNREATAKEVWNETGKNCSYSTIRKLLSILEKKGHVTHEKQGARFVYKPTIQLEAAATSALEKLTTTFFQGSVAKVATNLIGEKGHQISVEELDRIAQLIEEAKANR